MVNVRQTMQTVAAFCIYRGLYYYNRKILTAKVNRYIKRKIVFIFLI